MKKLLLTTILLLFLNIGNAQNRDSTNQKLQEPIELAEKDKGNIGNEYLLKSEFDSEYKPFIENWKTILGLLGIASMLGIAAYLYLFFKFIPNYVTTKVREKTDEIIKKELTDRHNDFIAMLKDYDFEKNAKQKYRIKLLTHKKGSDAYIHKLLTQNGFNVSSETNLEQLDDANIEVGDVVFVNSDGGVWKKEDIQKYFQKLDNYTFYFGGERIELSEKHQELFAAANIKTQFIGNLLNLLKYN